MPNYAIMQNGEAYLMQLYLGINSWILIGNITMHKKIEIISTNNPYRR